MRLTTSMGFGLLCRRFSVIAIVLVLLLGSACGKSQASPEDLAKQADIFVPTVTSTTDSTDSGTPDTVEATIEKPVETVGIKAIDTDTLPSLTNAPVAPMTATPLPLPVGPCLWNADYIEDLNLPDGFSVQPATPVRKIWRLVNNGNCPWPPGTKLVVVAGNQLSVLPENSVPESTAGTPAEISLDFISPGKPGDYTSFLRLRAPDGQLFGSVVYLKFSVLTTAPPLVFATPSDTAPVPVGPASTTTPALPTPTPVRSLPTATPMPTLAPTATAKPTSTPRASTPIPTNTPTATPTATALKTDETSITLPPTAQTCSEPEAIFNSIINQAGILPLDMDCAVTPLYKTNGYIQAYFADANINDPGLNHLSLLILREDTQEILVIEGQDTIGSFATVRIAANSWNNTLPDMPMACLDMRAPNGYTLPVRSFGYLWCEQALYDTLGWPKLPAVEVWLSIQQTDNGLLIQATTLTGNQVLYTVAIDLDKQQASIQRAP